MGLFSRNYLSRYWRFMIPFEQIKMFFTFSTNKKTILIHTPGKVASTSVYVTLKEHFKNCNVYHFHYISPKGIEERVAKNLNSKRKSLPLHLITSREFAKKHDVLSQKTKMIVLIREPINRYISATFQNLNMFFDNPKNAPIEEVKGIIEKGLKRQEHLNDLYWWFDTELKEHLKIDIFSDEHLVHNNDYWCFKNENVDLYVLKLENVSEIFTDFCKRELGVEDLELINSNIASNKEYSQMYKKVKSEMVISQEIFDEASKSLYQQRFYNS